jgi:hypothetical protein
MMPPQCHGKDSTKKMGGRALERGRFSLLSLLVLDACSATPLPSPRDVADANDTGRALAARTDDERAVLGQLPTLASGQPRRLGSVTVTAEAPYTAASGRTCRALQLTPTAAPVTRHRLACREGAAWFFVPDVFEGEHGAARE